MSRAALEKSVFRVEELDCATEENELREALGGLADVSSLEFDLVARRVTVTHRFDSPSPIESAIRAAGMRPRLIIPVAGESVTRGGSPPRVPRSVIVTAIVAGILALGSEGLVIGGLEESSAPVIAMAVAAIALGGRETLMKGWKALTSRRLTMNLSVRLLLRVRRPSALLPHRSTGPFLRPTGDLASPPPCGWSRGLLTTPRT